MLRPLTPPDQGVSGHWERSFSGQQGLSPLTDTCKFVMLMSSDSSTSTSDKFTPKSEVWRSHYYFSFPLLINHIFSKTSVTIESSWANFLLVFYHKERKLLEGSDSWSHLRTSSFSTPVPLWHQCQFFSPAVSWGCVNRKATSRLKPRKSQLITACAVSCMYNELLIIGENELELEDLALNKYRLEIKRFLSIQLARSWSTLW